MKTSMFSWLFKSKDQPHPQVSSTVSRHSRQMQKAGCKATATWHNSANQHFCDQHKPTMDMLLRMNGHNPGWERL